MKLGPHAMFILGSVANNRHLGWYNLKLGELEAKTPGLKYLSVNSIVQDREMSINSLISLEATTSGAAEISIVGSLILPPASNSLWLVLRKAS